jgi:hypothetical protein
LSKSVAKNVVFKLGTVGVPGTATDISAKLSSVKPSWDVDNLETTTFGTSGTKSHGAGLVDGTISIEGFWDAAIETHLTGLLGQDNGGTGIAFEHGPIGSTSGDPKTTGNCILLKYEPPTNVGASNKFTAELQVSGAATRGTYA